MDHSNLNIIDTRYMKNSFDLNDKDILITGGTGSLGKALVKEILKKWPKVNKLIIFFSYWKH